MEGRRRPTKKRKVLPFVRGSADRHPPFFFSVPRLPGETGEVLTAHTLDALNAPLFALSLLPVSWPGGKRERERGRREGRRARPPPLEVEDEPLPCERAAVVPAEEAAPLGAAARHARGEERARPAGHGAHRAYRLQRIGLVHGHGRRRDDQAAVGERERVVRPEQPGVRREGERLRRGGGVAQ